MSNRWKTKSFVFRGIGVFILAMVACGGPSNSGGGSTSGASEDLETVKNDLVPASLDYEQNNASLNQMETLIMRAEGGGSDPCAAVDNDLFACQPVLLQLYMDLAKDFLDIVLNVVTETDTAIAEAPDGWTGSFDMGGGITVTYSKTSVTDYSILLSSSEGSSIGYIDINSGEYLLRMNLASLAEAEDDAPELFEILVNYTDENTWDMTAFMTGLPCTDSDARAPEKFRLVVNKVGGLWVGKAMFYNGRWLYGMAEGTSGDPTCETEESDELSVNFYTDFVGNDTAAKASVYVMSRTVDSLDNIADYGMDSLDENFGAGFDTTAYINPFCNEAGTLTATWNDDCLAVDDTVSSTDFGPQSDWIVPSEFYLEEITVPESL